MTDTTTDRRRLSGSGEPCTCGEHRQRCLFGRQHGWAMGYIPEALTEHFGVDIDLARRGIAHCITCNAVHVPDDEERADYEQERAANRRAKVAEHYAPELVEALRGLMTDPDVTAVMSPEAWEKADTLLARLDQEANG